MDEYYTVPEIANIFKVDDATIRLWLNSGGLCAGVPLMCEVSLLFALS